MSFLAVWIVLVAPPADAPRPSPALGPAEVVRIVVEALGKNNSPLPNAGVFIAYQFASPANHAVTGPYGHFLRTVKTKDFVPLFQEHPREFGEIAVSGDYAEQILRLRLDDARTASYKFTMSLQKKGSRRGCWMVDGVSRRAGAEAPVAGRSPLYSSKPSGRRGTALSISARFRAWRRAA